MSRGQYVLPGRHPDWPSGRLCHYLCNPLRTVGAHRQDRCAKGYNQCFQKSPAAVQSMQDGCILDESVIHRRSEQADKSFVLHLLRWVRTSPRVSEFSRDYDSQFPSGIAILRFPQGLRFPDFSRDYDCQPDARITILHLQGCGSPLTGVADQILAVTTRGRHPQRLKSHTEAIGVIQIIQY